MDFIFKVNLFLFKSYLTFQIHPTFCIKIFFKAGRIVYIVTCEGLTDNFLKGGESPPSPLTVRTGEGGGGRREEGGGQQTFKVAKERQL